MDKIPYNIIIRLLKRVLMYADTEPYQEKTIFEAIQVLEELK
jgi:hypothetical protein